MIQFDAQAYRRDGFAVLSGFKSPEDVAALRSRARQIVDTFDVSDAGVFTTRDQARKSDAYFLESGDKIRCFFEEDVFDDRGDLRQSKSLSINKIAHAMHDLDPMFERLSVDVHLQAAAHRRRSALASRRRLLLYRTARRYGVLVCS